MSLGLKVAIVVPIAASACVLAGCAGQHSASAPVAPVRHVASKVSRAARLRERRIAARLHRLEVQRIRLRLLAKQRAYAERAEIALGTQTFGGTYFSISYPTSWSVVANETRIGSYYDTTIRDPRDASKMLRIDVVPQATTDALTNARQVESALSSQPGYREIAFTPTSFNGYDAIRWEFLVDEHGVLLHKVDVMFMDNLGDDIAVLTQAPAPTYEYWKRSFSRLRLSLTPNDSSTSTGGDSGSAGLAQPADFCTTHACIDSFYNGNGYIVQCADGMWSHSGGLSGACSYHGGETNNVYTGSASSPPPSYTAPSSGGTDLGSGNGYTVTCADGSISHSGGIQGACSHHGGVGP